MATKQNQHQIQKARTIKVIKVKQVVVMVTLNAEKQKKKIQRKKSIKNAKQTPSVLQ
tara:strand:+ start:1652 stop:1822 length:171 start_codon:yes stop_codon:yes gene_type:complete